MPLKRPSPEAIEQVKVEISPTAGAAVALAGSYDGTPQWAERVAALSQVLTQPALSQQQIEHRLSTHIVTMDELFYRLLTAAHDAPGAETKLATIEAALKVQSAIRKTALAMDSIRNPKKPTQFIKNYVDRQLNQLLPSEAPIPLPESDRPHAEILDSRTTSSATGKNSTVETVGAIERGFDSTRESPVQQKFF